MSINLTLILVILILAVAAIRGWKNGLIQELITLIALVAITVALFLIATGVDGYFEKNYAKVIFIVVVLLVLLLAFQLAKWIFASVKLLSKVPVISGVNKLAGIVLGFAEGLVLIWSAMIVMNLFEKTAAAQFFIHQISDNKVLTFLYHSNLIEKLVSSLAK